MNDLLERILRMLRNCKVFVSSKEKMHPAGIELYEQLIKDIEKLENDD